jgi:BirA family biotin operon repressor/biotin-[acetyl-CoA-carboxylase] ligase
VTALGRPRLHLASTASTNDVARALAQAGAPHGTTVTAAQQTAGRGRQGRTWAAAPGRALLVSVVVRRLDPLLPLAAAVAVAESCGSAAAIKWPNDVLLDGRKVSGILVEGRPQEGWAVVGIGVNVAVRETDLPPELRATAATLGREPQDVEPFLAALLRALEGAIGAPDVLARWRSRDALLGRPVRWAQGEGTGAGVTHEGHLLVDTPRGRVELQAGEVHLRPV